MIPTLKRYYYQMSSSVRDFTFVVSTGRAGTKTLSVFIEGIRGVTSKHEPVPVMNAEILQDASYGTGELALKTFMDEKLPAIFRDCSKDSAKHYVETNHLFIKSFYKPAIEFFNRKLKVINMVSDAKHVAYSIYQLNEIPGEPEGNKWYLDPHGEGNLIDVREKLVDEFDHQYYACLWYVLEIEARAERLKKEFKGKILTIKTDELNSITKLEELCSFIGVEASRGYIPSFINQRYNQQKEYKTQMDRPQLTPEEMSEMNQKLHNLIVR